jgi:hypothetical protein
MLDVVLGLLALEKTKEAFTVTDPKATTVDSEEKKQVVVSTQSVQPMTWKEYFSSPFRIASFAFSFLISLYAAYLSWSCNTALGYGVFTRLILSFFAFMFGTLYVIFYFVFRSDTCSNIIANAKSVNVPAPAPVVAPAPAVSGFSSLFNRAPAPVPAPAPVVAPATASEGIFSKLFAKRV